MGVIREQAGVFKGSFPLGPGLAGVLSVGRAGFEDAETGDADFDDMGDFVGFDETVEGIDEDDDAEGIASRKT